MDISEVKVTIRGLVCRCMGVWLYAGDDVCQRGEAIEMMYQDIGFKRMNDDGRCGCIGVDMVVVASSNLYRITQGDRRPVWRFLSRFRSWRFGPSRILNASEDFPFPSVSFLMICRQRSTKTSLTLARLRAEVS